MTFSQIVSSFRANPRDVSTAPISDVQPKYFYVYVIAGSLYVSRAKTHKPSCSITNERKLNANEFETMLSIYHRRNAGEKVSQEAVRATINSIYWYGIFNDMKC